MPSALEFRLEERIHDFLRRIGRGVQSGQAKHVGVVMLARQRGGCLVAHQCRARAGHLVGRHRHPHARLAHQNAKPALARGHCPRHAACEVRIIARLVAQRPEVRHLQPALRQVRLQRFL